VISLEGGCPGGNGPHPHPWTGLPPGGRVKMFSVHTSDPEMSVGVYSQASGDNVRPLGLTLSPLLVAAVPAGSSPVFRAMACLSGKGRVGLTGGLKIGLKTRPAGAPETAADGARKRTARTTSWAKSARCAFRPARLRWALRRVLNCETVPLLIQRHSL
jgi:hypothetical protein